MKKGIIIILLGIVTGYLAAKTSSSKEKNDTLTVGIDSLDCHDYNIRNITLLVEDKQVDYTIVFDSITQQKKTEFTQMHGELIPFNAIKHYGEKYRKGLLVYKKESENENE